MILNLFAETNKFSYLCSSREYRFLYLHIFTGTIIYEFSEAFGSKSIRYFCNLKTFVKV